MTAIGIHRVDDGDVVRSAINPDVNYPTAASVTNQSQTISAQHHNVLIAPDREGEEEEEVEETHESHIISSGWST